MTRWVTFTGLDSFKFYSPPHQSSMQVIGPSLLDRFRSLVRRAWGAMWVWDVAVPLTGYSLGRRRVFRPFRFFRGLWGAVWGWDCSYCGPLLVSRPDQHNGCAFRVFRPWRWVKGIFG